MNVVTRAILFARKLAEVRELAQAVKDEIAALGGMATATNPYFLDSEGVARTDLEITQATFNGLLTTGEALLTALNAESGHRTNIYKAINGK